MKKGIHLISVQECILRLFSIMVDGKTAGIKALTIMLFCLMAPTAQGAIMQLARSAGVK